MSLEKVERYKKVESSRSFYTMLKIYFFLNFEIFFKNESRRLLSKLASFGEFESQ